MSASFSALISLPAPPPDDAACDERVRSPLLTFGVDLDVIAERTIVLFADDDYVSASLLCCSARPNPISSQPSKKAESYNSRSSDAYM